ncbi:MAG: DNA ligase [Deltaproteobacteria bacterium]|nr:DNA ligase [Deltaproteobacteria bacterium]MBU49674.1 DNA ligase [Deltaproteobacteria bacterium]|tara:strand:- start:7710 stop:8501 length:792 start_codon:yes stop_codon:yes gene_type:complete
MYAEMHKYPRTHHIEGSRLQPGDEDLDSVRFREIKGKHLVVEEKMDGANAGISFGPDGELRLQSRGHYLTGGARERQFHLFKQWASCIAPMLWEVIGTRYVVYGEWLYAKHTMYYDMLPHYFMEFDILDLETGHFLSTPERMGMLDGLPIVSVAVLHQGKVKSAKLFHDWIETSLFVSPGRDEHFREECEQRKLNLERSWKGTDRSTDMEGLYIKHEEDGIVKGRYKFVRASFLTAITQSEEHWLDRPIIPNRLAPDVNIFQF